MSEDADITADVAVIRQELLRRAASDQLVREQLDPRFPTSQQCQRVHEVDADNLDFWRP